MNTFLFDQVIFGPVKSRRFGNSLGINLLPANGKMCTFDCIYCECGWTNLTSPDHGKIPSVETVLSELENKLLRMKEAGNIPDHLTFAGNGEPTIHPGFPEIVDGTIRLRDIYFPACRIAVLSNSSLIRSGRVFEALLKVEANVLKLDTAVEETFRLINGPKTGVTVKEIIDNLKRFNGHLTVQTLFIRGFYKGQKIDNTTDQEIGKWLEAIKLIRPESVMIYPIERATPVERLEKISRSELENIALKIQNESIHCDVYY